MMPNPTAHPRLCAAVALASVAVHVWMAFGHSHAWWQSAAMLLMAAYCLPCALTLWRRGAAHPAAMLLWSAAGMAGLHLVLLAAAALPAGHSHHGGTSAHLEAAQSGPMLAVIALELAVAVLAASWLRRLRLAAVHAA
ncbi:hypothetical protein LVY72_19300 [Arthrobacter sp. I2-34]|uniref:Uncharacterized protein n=1 Tax=Arthrobacter hankyongi TaxID=2904801 RepID=A0ABS9LC52_9MICC|nr:hypothetical protein [Arthrobacter hankyongi]MCG2624044.1 hypothetical protein [Arthrobacter hankyongi]